MEAADIHPGLKTITKGSLLTRRLNAQVIGVRRGMATESCASADLDQMPDSMTGNGDTAGDTGVNIATLEKRVVRILMISAVTVITRNVVDMTGITRLVAGVMVIPNPEAARITAAVGNIHKVTAAGWTKRPMR